MMKTIVMSCLLISGNVFAQSAQAELAAMEIKGLISPHDMASKVRAQVAADVAAKKSTLDIVNMWREVTIFMTPEEKIAYTKEFLAALEKQEASLRAEQELLHERQRHNARQLDMQRANAERAQEEQAFNHKVKIAIGIAAAIVVVVVIYYIIKKSSSDNESVRSAPTVRLRDPVTSSTFYRFIDSSRSFGLEPLYGYGYQAPAARYRGVGQRRTDTPSTLAFDQMRHTANRMYDVGDSLLGGARAGISSALSRSAAPRSMFV